MSLSLFCRCFQVMFAHHRWMPGWSGSSNSHRHTPEHGGYENTFSSSVCVCAWEHVCGEGEHMNNGCSHKLMVGQIRRDNVNKELLLVHLSGRRWAFAEVERATEAACHGRIHLLAIYTHLWCQTERETERERDRQRERGRGGAAGVCKCCLWPNSKEEKWYY